MTWAKPPAEQPRERKSPTKCGACGQLRDAHSEHWSCGMPVQHHTEQEKAWCEEGRARMASAKLAAGRELTTVEKKALKLYPAPRRLSPEGYV